MTHFALELQDTDLSLTMVHGRATLARGHAQGVTFEVAELENLVDRLRIASELYAVTESLCGTLLEPAPAEEAPPAVPAFVPEPSPRPERLPRRAPAPPLPAITEDHQKPPRPVLVVTTEETETWQISETVRRRRRLTEPGTLTVAGGDRITASEGDVQRQAPTEPQPRTPMSQEPDAPQPTVQPQRPATAGGTPSVEPTPSATRKALDVPTRLPSATPPPTLAAPAGQPSTWFTGAAAAVGGSAEPPARAMGGSAEPPARPDVTRPAGPDAGGPDKPGAYIPPLPKGAARPPQLTDVMVHFLKHNGPSTLDDAVRYVKSLRLWPAAMNLRLSVTIALQKTSCGFTKLRDGRYALDPEAT